MYNILFTYPTVFNPERGGVERVTDLLAREFARRGHCVKYLHTMQSREELFIPPFETFYTPQSGYTAPENKDFYHRFLKHHDIDVVVNQCGAHGDSILFNDTIGSKAKSISVIHFNPEMNYHHLWDEISVLRNSSILEKIKRIGRCLLFKKIKHNYIKRIRHHYRWLFGHTDCVLLLSQRFIPSLRTLSGDAYDMGKMGFIPNPIKLLPTQDSPKEKIILWVGRFDIKQKRPDICLKIWEQINVHFPDWRLVMIGGGHDYYRIVKMARNIPRVTFTGFTNPEPYYEKAEMLLMTSSFEGWGMVLTEGISHSVLPMAFDSYESLHDILDHDEIIVKDGNINEYANKLAGLLSNNNRRNELREYYKTKAEIFAIDYIADKWEDIFDKLHIK